ncbi:MAG: ribulose-phosphate 3-epimerase [Sedimentisphaerales bacterium]
MRLPKTGKIEIVPSILSADFSRLGREIAEVEEAGVEMVHLDVMDGHFVPNITIGPPVIKSLRKTTDLFFDAHLMISEPEKYIESFAKAGVNNITFHIEVTEDPLEIADKLHKLGCSASLCLNPETPVEAIEPIAKFFDMILVMTVHPGFGGQKFMPDAAKKVIKIREIVGPDVRIEVDGGIDHKTAPIVVSYGADTLVAGSAIFDETDRKAAINAIRNAFK